MGLVTGIENPLSKRHLVQEVISHKLNTIHMKHYIVILFCIIITHINAKKH